jgi:hypothetical protein
MGRESQVEIPPSSGNYYRYQYDGSSGKTVYLGPIGSAPQLGEEEFLSMLMADFDTKRNALIDAIENKENALVILDRRDSIAQYVPKRLLRVGDVGVYGEYQPDLQEPPTEQRRELFGEWSDVSGWWDGLLTNAYREGQLFRIAHYEELHPEVAAQVRYIAQGEPLVLPTGEVVEKHPRFHIIGEVIADSPTGPPNVSEQDIEAYPVIDLRRYIEDRNLK